MKPQEPPSLHHTNHSRTHTRELADFNRKRRHNALRLKNRFADIIERYGHDFEDVGDVIDLETEKVVVDNGHLSNMERELDPAYDLCTWGEDEEGGEGEEEEALLVDSEEIDELGADMLTEGEIEALRGGPVFQMDDGGDGDLGEESQVHLASREEDMDMALVTLPPTELSPVSIGEQKKFEAPMFPQLEVAVNSMTSMLQQQMMAMLGQVLPPQTIPQPMPESRQITPALAPHMSLKRNCDEITRSHSVEPGRIQTESPEPRMPSPKSYALKRRRISKAQEEKEGPSKGALGRKTFSSPIKIREMGTPQPKTHGASLWKTPKSMPARSQLSMALRSLKVKARTRVESESSPAKSILKISQLLPDDDTSEDELGSLVTPRCLDGSTKKASSPKASTLTRLSSPTDDIPKAASPKGDARRLLSPATDRSKSRIPTAPPPPIDDVQEPASPKENAPTASSPKVNSPRLPSSTPRKLSPRVVITVRAITTTESPDTDEENISDPVVQSPTPKRDRRRKPKILFSEQHKDSESLLLTKVDGLIYNSDVQPSQSLNTDEDMPEDNGKTESLEEATSDATAKAEPPKAPKRRRKTALDNLLAEAVQYAPMSRTARDLMESRLAIFEAQKHPIGHRMSVDSHVMNSEDEANETGQSSPKAMENGPSTIMDMTILKDAPVPQEEMAIPQRQSTLRSAAASSERRGSRAVLFVPEAEAIADSQDEEDDAMEDKNVENQVKLEKWVEDPNSQLVVE